MPTTDKTWSFGCSTKSQLHRPRIPTSFYSLYMKNNEVMTNLGSHAQLIYEIPCVFHTKHTSVFSRHYHK